jgi:hypothetical protein
MFERFGRSLIAAFGEQCYPNVDTKSGLEESGAEKSCVGIR